MAEPIWFAGVDLAALNALHAGDINGYLGVEITGHGPDWLEGRMPVNAHTRQPYGVLHGGASEVLASVAAVLTVDAERFACFGQEVNANHLRGVTDGHVTGVARPFHLGRTSQVWGVDLRDDEGRPTCVARLTIAVVPRRG